MPAITMDPAQFHKITKIQEESTLANEFLRIGGRPEQRHAATRRHVFKNVLATPNGFFTLRSAHNQLSRLNLVELLRAPIYQREKGLHALPAIGSKYFGHWLLDCLPTTQLLRPDEDLYMPTPQNWPHAEAYAQLLDMPPALGGYVFFREMAFCYDFGKNSHLAARITRLRAQVQACCDTDVRKKIYFKRGDTGSVRLLVNEDDLIAKLVAKGFEVVSVEAELQTILNACCRAHTLVSIQGSQLAHGLLAAAEDTTFVTINLSDRFENCFSDYMGILGGRIGTVVADAVPEGYRVDIPHLLGMLDAMEDHPG